MRNKPMGLMERATRTILDIKTALALTAKRHGINTIAGKYGFHPQQLYNNLNVNDPDRAPTLAQFELITEFARDHDDHQQILDALSRVTGCVWIPIPDAEDVTDTELFTEVAELVDRVGRMCRSTRDAVSDGRVDECEVAVLEKDLHRLIQAGYRLMEGAKSYG